MVVMLEVRSRGRDEYIGIGTFGEQILRVPDEGYKDNLKITVYA
jgi:hypothetical protein